MNYQAGITAPITNHAIFIEYGIINTKLVAKSLETLSEELKDTEHIVGIGSPLIEALNSKVPGLKRFPQYSNHLYHIPITQYALFTILQGDELAPLDVLADTVSKKVSEAFEVAEKTKGFKYQEGRDLTGFEYGTNNPSGDAAISTAIVNDKRKTLLGSSYVTIHRWVHDFDSFNNMQNEEKDKRIGRYRGTNEVFDAPRYAHVNKTAQENFDPQAFRLRRSMPWSDTRGRGLVFIAFGNTLRAFDVQMKNMIGLEDNISDGVFDFSMPATGAHYWCPPIEDGKLDLSLVLT